MTNKQRIQKLKEEKECLRKKIEVIEPQIKFLIDERSAIFEKMNDLSEQIHKLYGRSDELEITDHAFLRYMERVQGFDIELLKGELRKKLPSAPANGTMKIENVIFVFKNNALVTVLPNT